MPVLRAEPCLFPTGLFEETLSIEAEPAARAWRVLHTKPRQEKALARELHHRQTPYYLPLMTRRTRQSGRIITAHLPLFSGYVFVYGSNDEQLAALSTHRVANSLEVYDQLQLRDDLLQVFRLISMDLPIHPEERFGPGDQVTIRGGMLAGFRGEILRSATGRRFLVKVNFLQQGASILLDDVDLALAVHDHCGPDATDSAPARAPSGERNASLMTARHSASAGTHHDFACHLDATSGPTGKKIRTSDS